MIIKNKKELMLMILYTIVLLFAFINFNTCLDVIRFILNILNPFIIGFVIAFIINVLMMGIENKWLTKIFSKSSRSTRRIISLLMSLALILGFLTLLINLVIPQLGNAVDIFMENVPNYKENIGEFSEAIGINLSLEEGIVSDLVNEVSNYISENKSDIINQTLGIATNLVNGVVNITIAVVFAIYLLLNKDTLLRQYNKLLAAYVQKDKIKKLKEISELSNKTFSNFVVGQCMEALIIGVLCFIGMLILGLPYATTISVLVGFTALIPVFGAFIGTAIGAILILMVSPLEAIIFIVFIIVLQQFEGNLIYPKVVGKSVGLPSIWVLAAVTVGASLGGVIGMLLAVPICSILYSILAANVNARLAKKTKEGRPAKA